MGGLDDLVEAVVDIEDVAEASTKPAELLEDVVENRLLVVFVLGAAGWGVANVSGHPFSRSSRGVTSRVLNHPWTASGHHDSRRPRRKRERTASRLRPNQIVLTAKRYVSANSPFIALIASLNVCTFIVSVVNRTPSS